MANAVFQACGAEFYSNVLKPEKVLKAIKEAEKKGKRTSRGARKGTRKGK
jgi:hypothetical protein